jgi:hypothetical protein
VWMTLVYQCAWGHRVELVLGRGPKILEIRHGVKPMGFPRCTAPLYFVTAREFKPDVDNLGPTNQNLR